MPTLDPRVDAYIAAAPAFAQPPQPSRRQMDLKAHGSGLRQVQRPVWQDYRLEREASEDTRIIADRTTRTGSQAWNILPLLRVLHLSVLRSTAEDGLPKISHARDNCPRLL